MKIHLPSKRAPIGFNWVLTWGYNVRGPHYDKHLKNCKIEIWSPANLFSFFGIEIMVWSPHPVYRPKDDQFRKKLRACRVIGWALEPVK